MAEPAGTPLANPYPGPRPFGEADAAYFFGRERPAEALFSLVLSTRVLLVLAPSGTGKTSLLRARLIPRLQAAGFDVLPLARVGTRVDCETPATNVYTLSALADLIGGGAAAGQSACVPAGLGLDAFLKPGPAGAGDEVVPRVLIFDQFEEILTRFPERHGDRERFFQQLARALEQDPALSIVFALREEYVAGLERYGPLLPGALQRRFYLDPLSYEAAVEAIERPARLAQRPFAPGVARELADRLRQVRTSGIEGTRAGEWVEPVMLQVVCFKLWQSLCGRRGEEIGRKDLERFGPIEGALEKFYDEAIGTVAAAGDATERQLREWFGETLISAGPPPIRGQVREEDACLSQAAVERLVAAHLVRREERRGGLWLELVHDSLVGPVLSSNQLWLAEQHRLIQDAKVWEAAGSPEDEQLYQGEELEAALRWAEHNPQALTPLERRFLARSNARQRRRVGLFAAVLVALVALLAWGGYRDHLSARDQRRSAAWGLAFAASESLAEDPEKALESAVAAAEATWARDQELVNGAELVLVEALYTPRARRLASLPGVHAALAMSADGTRLATLGLDRRVVIWNGEGRDMPSLRELEDQGEAIALSPDGRLLAAGQPLAGEVPTVAVFLADRDELVARLDFPEGPALALAWSLDGRYLAAAGPQATLAVWELPLGRRVLVGAALAGVEPRKLAWSPDSLLALGDSQGGIVVANLAGGVRAARSGVGGALDLAWSPDGRRLAVVGEQGDAVLLDSDGELARPPFGAELRAASFEPAGEHLLVASRQGSLQRFQGAAVDDWKLGLLGVSTLDQAVVSRDLSRLATLGDGRESALVWELALAPGRTLVPGGMAADAFCVSADEARLVVAKAGEGWSLHELPSGRERARRDGRGAGRRFACGPDGQSFASSGENGRVEVVPLADEGPAVILPHPGPVTALAFDRSGDQLAAATSAGVVHLWRWRRQELVRTLEAGAAVSALVFEPSANRLAIGHFDGRVRIHDLGARGEAAAALDLHDVGGQPAHERTITSLAWSLAGAQLATAADEPTVKLWEVGTGDPPRHLEHAGRVDAVSFSAAGARLATAGRDMVALWPLAAGHRGLPAAKLPPGARALAFLGDEKLALLRQNGAVQVLDLAVGELLRNARRRLDCLGDPGCGRFEW